MNNKHIFSKEYMEKKSAILDSIEKTEAAPAAVKRFPVKAVLAAAIVCVILTTSVIAAGVIGRQFKLNMDYIPEATRTVVVGDERFEMEGFPSLEFYVKDLEGKEFDPTVDMSSESTEDLVCDSFTANGHNAQILHYVCWDPEEDFEEFTDKQLFIHFEEEDLAVQVWASNLISVEELKKVAEGISLEPTDDGTVAVKIYK